MAESLSDVAIKQLSVAERLDLIGVLWDSIPEDQVPIPEWHQQELERRLAAADADPSGAIPWEEVRQRLQKK
jgi:putative addiction module component (TIGR02574 family)